MRLAAGDVADLSVLDFLRTLGSPLHAISGNIDGASLRAVVPERLERAFAGVRIGMTHIPGSPTERRRAPAHTMGMASIEGGRIAFEIVVVA